MGELKNGFSGSQLVVKVGHFRQSEKQKLQTAIRASGHSGDGFTGSGKFLGRNLDVFRSDQDIS